MEYNDFISQNVATVGARRIGIYNEQGNRVGQIPLGSLTPPNPAKRLYSFGVLSDVHIGDSTATSDFTKALKYLSKETDFICISGDLVHDGNNTSQWTEYKGLVDTYGNIPVYACTGNHDGYNTNLESLVSGYTGKPLYYSIVQGNDVFVFVGCRGNAVGELFTDAELTWLAETLEANKSKRVFLFQHVRPEDGCGNALGIYRYDCWGGSDQTSFENLLRTYPNIVFFHGHSHLKFDLQKYADNANIDRVFGCWSVHVPSISVPRGTNSAVNPSRVELYAESEGYVVDVYDNGIHLRGRDFVKGEFLPIASYWLDTTLQTIPAGTYTDSTGTIVT
jgi:predicted MPP superfamily phosphohydrolase